MSKLCVSDMCVSELCVSELCVSELCVTKCVCVCVRQLYVQVSCV